MYHYQHTAMGNPYISPFFSWVSMGDNPQESLENTINTINGTPKLSLENYEIEYSKHIQNKSAKFWVYTVHCNPTQSRPCTALNKLLVMLKVKMVATNILLVTLGFSGLTCRPNHLQIQSFTESKQATVTPVKLVKEASNINKKSYQHVKSWVRAHLFSKDGHSVGTSNWTTKETTQKSGWPYP